MYNGCVFQAGVLLIAAVLFGVLCAAGVSQVLASAGSDAGKRARRLMMAAALCAVVAGVLMLTLTSSYLNWMDNDNLLAEAAAPVFVIVFGVLLFAVSVAWTVREMRKPQPTGKAKFQQAPEAPMDEDDPYNE